MNAPTTAKAASAETFENLQKQLEDLRRGNVFLHLPSLASSVAAGVAFGLLAYVPSSNFLNALLVGLAVSLASVALNATERLHKHLDVILALLDGQTAVSRPDDAQ